MSFVQVNQVCKNFGKSHILKNIDLDIEKGDLYEDYKNSIQH